MLAELRIRDLGVIDDVTIDLAPGLTVVTGETGAGKTMVVSSLGLLLGGRADAGLVRGGAAQAVVEARIRLGADHPAVVRAAEAGAALDHDGELLIGRTVLAGGRSRAHLGGLGVPAGTLGELGETWATLHGQADALSLLRPAARRAALDRYGALAPALDEYRARYDGWRELAARCADIAASAARRRDEAELLQRGLVDIGQVDPQPGEDEALAAEAHRLGNVDALRLAAQSSRDALAGDPAAAVDAADAGGLIGIAARALAAADDPALRVIATTIAEAGVLIGDAVGELRRYLDGLDADPARLAVVEARRAALRSLTRTYGATVDDVLAWVADARDRLALLDPSGATLDRLRADRDAAAEATAAAAGALSRGRADAASRLGTAVTAELAAVAMPDALARIDVHPRAATEGAPVLDVDGTPRTLTRDGGDDVDFLLVAHRGAPARPVERGASGGELSRVMLALEVVLAGADPVPTMVFDEVDAGVGGAAATEVGRRLARLARDHQVVVVTHLPQVAAYADRHLVVTKDATGAVGRSGVAAVEGAARARELARMLAGLADSELGQAHAEELLSAAARDKQSRRHSAPP
ncbi:MAG: DNA repair protein RecN [Pseudonocardiales bacterium]|nr:MAG: DNA repair protein RecN [Pseudonocardiales bacterium]